MLPDLAGIAGSDVGPLVRDVKFGDYNMTDVAMVWYGALRKGYAGMFQIEPMTVEFMASIPDIVQAYLYQWKGLIIDNDSGGYYPKMNYALTAYVKLYDKDGTDSATFKLTGVFPKTFPRYHLSQSQEEVITYTIDFNVDRVWLVSATSGFLGIIASVAANIL
jgi:hypothetical protein